MCAAYSEVTTLYCNFAKFRTPNILFLDSTLSRFDSTFWLDSTLKLNYGTISKLGKIKKRLGLTTNFLMPPMTAFTYLLIQLFDYNRLFSSLNQFLK